MSGPACKRMCLLCCLASSLPACARHGHGDDDHCGSDLAGRLELCVPLAELSVKAKNTFAPPKSLRQFRKTFNSWPLRGGGDRPCNSPSSPQLPAHFIKSWGRPRKIKIFMSSFRSPKNQKWPWRPLRLLRRRSRLRSLPAPIPRLGLLR